MLDVLRVPVLSDNYSWLVHDPASGETAAVDPGEGAPVLDAAAARGWRIGQVWITHWHHDHTGGLDALKARGAVATGPAAELARIPALDRTVSDGDRVRLGGHEARVIATPGHTLGHVALHLADDGLLFTGDALFAMGAGRLFEGTAEQMHGYMRVLAALPPETWVYCGHEYTQANGRYALSADGGDRALVARMAVVDALRARGEPTVPSTLADELATNPFLRARSAEELAAHRAAKDRFRG